MPMLRTLQVAKEKGHKLLPKCARYDSFVGVGGGSFVVGVKAIGPNACEPYFVSGANK